MSNSNPKFDGSVFVVRAPQNAISQKATNVTYESKFDTNGKRLGTPM